MTKIVATVVAITLTLLFLSACSSTAKRVSGYDINADLTGLVLDTSVAPTVLYSRPGAPDVSEYSRFIIDPVLIDYRDPEMSELAVEDISRIQRYFQDKLISEFREAGLVVATRSEPGTLRLSFLLSGLEAPTAIANVSVLVAGPIALSVGEVTVEAVFTDAESGQINAVAVATTEGSRLFNSSPWSTWEDVESALDQWAAGIRQRIIDDR